MSSPPLEAHIDNPGKPAKGQWDFKLEPVLTIKQAGDEVLARPDGILAFDDGSLIIHDRKHRTNFAFDGSGTFVKSFGQKGEGPGEIKSEIFIHAVGNMMVVPDGGKVHYFSSRGDYIKSVKINPGPPPSLFLDKHRFILAPHSIYGVTGKKPQIKSVHLLDGSKTVLAEFEIFKGGQGESGGEVHDVMVAGLTPTMTIGSDGKHLYYGMNDKYRIQIIDLKGKKINSFSLQKAPKKISMKRKQDIFKNSRIPREVTNQIVKSLPDSMSFFHRIEIHNHKIYILCAEVGPYRRTQEIDIFSKQGKYLYRAVIDFKKSRMLFSPFHNLRIVNNHLYVVLENEEGEIMVAKYRILLP
jgi:hypothetical protein